MSDEFIVRPCVWLQASGYGQDVGQHGMMMGNERLSAMLALDNEGLETYRPLSHSMQLSEDLVSL
jgi:hypothetical protein